MQDRPPLPTSHRLMPAQGQGGSDIQTAGLCCRDAAGHKFLLVYERGEGVLAVLSR